VGESSLHAAGKLDYTSVAAGSHAAEAELLRRLADGTLTADFPRIATPPKIGIGQSMGGCMTIIHQGRYHGYDGIGVLGYSAVHTHPPTRPGTAPIVAPWLPRDTLLKQPLTVLNGRALAEAAATPRPAAGGSAMAWGFHYEDVDPTIVEQDLAHFAQGIHDPANQRGYVAPRWTSRTTPGAVARKGCDRRSSRRVARRPIGPIRRRLRLSADGPHAQLRGHARAVLAADRNLQRLRARRERWGGSLARHEKVDFTVYEDLAPINDPTCRGGGRRREDWETSLPTVRRWRTNAPLILLS
jgi:hypothetical protein